MPVIAGPVAAAAASLLHALVFILAITAATLAGIVILAIIRLALDTLHLDTVLAVYLRLDIALVAGPPQTRIGDGRLERIQPDRPRARPVLRCRSVARCQPSR